jgi:hypothetical protein
MKIQTSLLPLTLLPLLGSARNIILGTRNNPGFFSHSAAWISGNDPCDPTMSTDLVVGDNSPCGVRFALRNFPDLHFEGCGTDNLEIWQTNQVIGGCIFAPKDVHCGGTSEFFTGKFLCSFGP